MPMEVTNVAAYSPFIDKLPRAKEPTMNTQLTIRLFSALFACATTALLLSGIDGLAAAPATDALLSQMNAEAVRLAS